MSAKPVAKGKQCGECSCTNFEPAAFGSKDKCRNCFHAHPPDSRSSAPRPTHPLPAHAGASRAPPPPGMKPLIDKATMEKMMAEKAEKAANKSMGPQDKHGAEDNKTAAPSSPVLGPDKAGASRIAAERAEKEKAERAAKLAAEKADKERADKERADKERADKERADKERADKERAEKERVEKERTEKERADKERTEKEKADKERADKEKAEKERADRERVEKEKAERDKERAEKMEKERAERAEKEKAERGERERAERERAEKERVERQEKERAERERVERERLEKERTEREKAEQERADRAAAEKAEQDKANTMAAEEAAEAPKHALRSFPPPSSRKVGGPSATMAVPANARTNSVIPKKQYATSVTPLATPNCDHAGTASHEAFCWTCGSRTEERASVDTELLCMCGNRCEESDKFCTRCGENVTITRGKLFEGVLDAHIRFSPFLIPKIVFDCTEHLKQHALSLEGIFRVPGNNDAIQSSRADYEQEYKSGAETTTSLVASCDDPHTVAGILKLYYRRLRVPVIPYNSYEDWLSVADNRMTPEGQTRKLQILISELPATHRNVLAYHLHLLCQVSANSAVNKMGPKNCAMVFGPGLLRGPDGGTSDAALAKEMALAVEVLGLLIEGYAELFPEGCPDPHGTKPNIAPQLGIARLRLRPGASLTVRDAPVVVAKLAPEKALEKQREEMEELAERAQKNYFKLQAMPQKDALEAQFNEFMESRKFALHTLVPVSEKLADADKWQMLCITNETQLAITEGKAGAMKDPTSLYEGWLLLIVNNSSKHSSYFFALRPGVLRYYTEKGDRKPVGEIVFSKSTARYQNSNSTTKSPNPQFPYPFVLDTHPDNPSSGKYALFSESKDSREAWMALLELAIIADPEKNKPLSADSAAYDLTLGMMIGIRTSVGRTGGTPLTAIAGERDFQEVVSYNFPSRGSKDTPPHKLKDFGFKDYCPSVFRRIRQHYGIDPSSYLLGVCGNADYLNFVSNSRSGEFFFYSHDRKYMIKTISQNECKCLFSNMSSYYRHLMSNPDCFLNKFFGLHKVKPADQSCKWFLVMGSVFPTHLKMHRLFDLKGSTHNRQVKPSDRGKDGTVYKDNDLVQQGTAFVVGAEMKAKLERQLKKDTEWLESLRIIDYSILVGMHYRQGYYASSTNVQVFVSDAFFGDNLGQTLALEFKLEDTVADVIRQCVKQMRALPKMLLNNPAQDFCFVRSDGREVLDDKAPMARQTPLTLMEIILREALPKTAVPHRSPQLASPTSSTNPRTQAISSWKSALAEMCPELSAALNPLSDSELMNLSSTEMVQKAKGNPIAACLLAELKHLVESVEPDLAPGLSMFAETEGGLSAKDEVGNEVILYFGIIDTLIEYNLKKKMEHQYKHKVKGLDETAFSVVEPNMYAQRLLGFITDKIR